MYHFVAFFTEIGGLDVCGLDIAAKCHEVLHRTVFTIVLSGKWDDLGVGAIKKDTFSASLERIPGMSPCAKQANICSMVERFFDMIS